MTDGLSLVGSHQLSTAAAGLKAEECLVSAAMLRTVTMPGLSYGSLLIDLSFPSVK